MALQIEKTVSTSGKKSNKTLTRVHLILDESGSMGCARQSTIDGFNEYINGLKNDKNKYLISLTKFEGGNIVNVFSDVDIRTVRELTFDDYTPCGMTNLNDAIGCTIQGMAFNKPRTLHNTLVVILTDGDENSSTEWSQPMVADLIKSKESDGWTVTFLGANIDTQQVSRSYAIHAENARSYTTTGMRGVMANLSASTVSYAASAVAGQSTNNMFSESLTGISEADWMKEDKKDGENKNG
jgi:hypothetical protein